MEVKSYSIISLGEGWRYKVWVRVLRDFLDLNILYILFETLNEEHVEKCELGYLYSNFAPIELSIQ